MRISAVRRLVSATGIIGLCAVPPAAFVAPAPAGPAAASLPLRRSAVSDTDVTLFLIGDAGAPAPAGDPVLIALTREASAAHAQHRVVVFLGDNIYPRGLPDTLDRGRAQAVQRINAQLHVQEASGARVIFVPGNHDWDAGHADGWAAIRREGAYIDHAGGDLSPGAGVAGASMLPANGCPGPAVVDVGARVRLVLLDSEWWLASGPKPTDGCPAATAEEVLDQLRHDIAGAGTRRVIVGAHHPVVSGGVHGEPVRWTDPFRSLPSALARRLIRDAQDFSGAKYRVLRAALDSVFASNPPFAFATGHDHALQVISRDHAPLFLVSGAGTFHHLDLVEPIRGTRFEAHESGYMRLDFVGDTGVRLSVRVVDASGTARDAYTQEWP
jgi:calcineurin-like phosphoesterase family protein